MWRIAVCGAWCGVLLAAGSVGAQDAALDQIYGNGVEAYYSGNYRQAYQLLSAAVRSGSTDPRVYYFRGLSGMFLGRAPDAQADFRHGAQLESSDSGSPYDVGRSLERIQGRMRLQLEGYRTFARVEAAKNRDNQRAKRFEALHQAQPPVSSAISKPAEAAQPGAPAGAPPAGKAGDDPFAEPAAAPAKPAAKAPDDPFAAPAEEKKAEAPAEKKADADPFGS